MSTHVLIYYGYFDSSFHRLVPQQDRYWRKDDRAESAGTLIERPAKQTDDIHFGFMEGFNCFFFVQVDELLLRAPVLFIEGRHGAIPSPSWARPDDEEAMQILTDAIVANPALRDLLARKIRTLHR